MTHRIPRLEFPRRDLKPIKLQELGLLYEEGRITASQRFKIEHHALADKATHFAVSQWGQVRIFAEHMIWVLNGSGQVVFKTGRG